MGQEHGNHQKEIPMLENGSKIVRKDQEYSSIVSVLTQVSIKTSSSVAMGWKNSPTGISIREAILTGSLTEKEDTSGMKEDITKGNS